MRQKNIRVFAYFTFILLAAALNGLFLPGCAPLVSASTRAQDQLWQEITPGSLDALRSDPQRKLAPQRYRAFQLNEAALASLLANAPMEFTEAAKDPQNEIALPMPDGKFARFRFVESPILSPELAAQFPEIKTYGGWGVDDPGTTVRFDRTSSGVHAIVFSPEGAVYLYPLFNGDKRTYASFFARDAGVEMSVGCLVGSVEPAITRPKGSPRRQSLRRSTANILSNGSTLRTFRLAVGATAEYTNFFGGTIGGAMNNGIVPALNAVNGIYRNDLAISLNLVAVLIYTNATTDPYTSGNLPQLLGQNQNNLDNVVGEDNFDVGHVFDAPPAPPGAIAGGGLATVGVVCNDGDEGRGASGLSVPTPGFPAFFELVVAHELGHQFGADHTFNGTVGNCGNAGQRNSDTAWEPGSGSTLMAYPGTCGSDNVEQNPGAPQPLNDSYFHGRSLKQIVEYLDKCGGCETTSPTNNTPPSITLPDSGFYIIPAQTPFTLRATATDAEDAFLSYCWEQTDLGSAGPPNGDRGDNPLFRSWLPNGSPSRAFPRMADLLIGTTVIGETLPATTRTLHFDLTVRDNHLSGGGYNQTFAVVSARGDRGPFTVTQPAAGTQALATRTLTVTWNVAGTDQSPISASRVRIRLSLFNGDNFPITLAANTPNDGSESVVISPANANTNQARIMVEAVDNIFFNISPAFTIIPAPTVSVTGGLSITRGGPSTTGAVAIVGDGRDLPGALTVGVTNLPLNATVTAANNSGTVMVTASAQCNAQLGTFPVRLIVTNTAGISVSTDFNLTIATNPSPTLGTYPNTAVTAGLSTLAIPSALPSDANNNLSTVTVGPSLPGGGTLSVNRTTGIVTISTVGTTQAGTHRITVQATDSCGNSGFSGFDLTVVHTPPQISRNANSLWTTQGGTSPAPVNVATVSDQQDLPGALTVTASAPAGITVLTMNSNGVITATATAACGVAPVSYTATLTVRDSDSMIASAPLPVIVDPNPPPTLGNYNNTGVTVGGSVTVVPNAPPSDPNNAVTLSVNPVALPGGGLLSVNQANGRVTVNTAPNTALGVYLVKVTVKDACGAVVTRGFNLTVRSATCVTEQKLIFAADTDNHRIQRFDGASWKEFGAFGSGLGQFNSPEAVVASGDGRKIYVADTGNRRIQWSQDGGATWAVFATSIVPQGLALDRDGNLYASDAQDNRVIRYPGGVPGTPVTLATGGSGAGRVSNPNGLAIDCRMNLYIADAGNNRILVIATADAAVIANTGTVVAGPGAGINPAQVMAPQGVAVDNAGKLYVADTGNDRVLLIASAPAPGAATVLCTLGPQPGQVRDAEGVTIAAFTSGPLAGVSSLVVSDTTNNRIQGTRLPAGSWALLPPPAGGGPGSGTGQFKLPSKIR